MKWTTKLDAVIMPVSETLLLSNLLVVSSIFPAMNATLLWLTIQQNRGQSAKDTNVLFYVEAAVTF